ncbi:AAA family ATPase [Propionispora hippei]|uniref:AAA domain-containing protein n=1 Tax=Propionispora hippei DSM 15287 TaxID=1123003 RepID=A0A1M6DXB5_9FIRM|nr:ATP-binding protein [Propionispora hippei]SHI77904.1 AAA domain-containing protein [Propionispora hippei DSM 15287]
MEPIAIFLIGAAASGKSTIARKVAERYNFCYLDKDILCNHFTGLLLQAKGYSPHDRDGCAYYTEVVREIEYQTLLNIADDNLRLGRSVILDAPFGAYFSNQDYISQLKQHCNWEKVKPIVLQITIDYSVLKKRMQLRALERDVWKFANWNTYIESIEKNQCKWTNVEIIQFDNSHEVVELERLSQLFHALQLDVTDL